MSAKRDIDKQKPQYPWTPRQRRQKKDGRLSRKQLRKASRNR